MSAAKNCIAPRAREKRRILFEGIRHAELKAQSRASKRGGESAAIRLTYIISEFLALSLSFSLSLSLSLSGSLTCARELALRRNEIARGRVNCVDRVFIGVSLWLSL